MNEKLLEALDLTVGNQLIHNIHEIDENDSLFDLGLDSIGFINIIIALEEDFDIFVDEEDLTLEKFGTLKSINEYVESQKHKL